MTISPHGNEIAALVADLEVERIMADRARNHAAFAGPHSECNLPQFQRKPTRSFDDGILDAPIREIEARQWRVMRCVAVAIREALIIGLLTVFLSTLILSVTP